MLSRRASQAVVAPCLGCHRRRRRPLLGPSPLLVSSRSWHRLRQMSHGAPDPHHRPEGSQLFGPSKQLLVFPCLDRCRRCPLLGLPSLLPTCLFLPMASSLPDVARRSARWIGALLDDPTLCSMARPSALQILLLVLCFTSRESGSAAQSLSTTRIRSPPLGSASFSTDPPPPGLLLHGSSRRRLLRLRLLPHKRLLRLLLAGQLLLDLGRCRSGLGKRTKGRRSCPGFGEIWCVRGGDDFGVCLESGAC